MTQETMIEDELNRIIGLAQMSAKIATQNMLDENPGQWYPCGFAWVKIRPARGPLVKRLRELGIGSTSPEGGFIIHNPSRNSTQWMDAKRAGANSFVAVLKRHFPDLNIYAEERID